MTKQSYKRRLSADAKVVLALMEMQPLTFLDLCKRAGISKSQLYRIMHVLLGEKKVRVISDTPQVAERKYALEDYTTLEEVFIRFKEKYSEVSLDDLAYEVGESPRKIESKAYELAKKYGLKIGPETKLKMKSLKGAF